MMKVNNVIYSKKEVLKMCYYFQNRSLLRIMWEWIKLKFSKKVTIEEFQYVEVYQ